MADCLGILMLIFFFNDTATPEIYTLPLHDALPISLLGRLLSWITAASKPPPPMNRPVRRSVVTAWIRSMPPTVLMYLAMMSSAVCADSGMGRGGGAGKHANATSRAFRKDLSSSNEDCSSSI